MSCVSLKFVWVVNAENYAQADGTQRNRGPERERERERISLTNNLMPILNNRWYDPILEHMIHDRWFIWY